MNPSIKNNSLWAYLIIGFNVFYGIPSVVFLAISVLYFVVYKYFGTTFFAHSTITLVHFIFVICLWNTLRYKQRISSFIEKQVERKPLQLIGLTGIPTIISLVCLPIVYRMMPGLSIKYPVRMFHGGLVEFSFYFAWLTVIGVVLVLIFSIQRGGNITLKSLFEKPSVLSLLLLGFGVELIAASTRAIRIDNMVLHAGVFGLVYLAASFLISYYNRISNINRYLLLMMGIGFVLEISGGIAADIDRGDTYFTVYFVSALITGVALGRILGAKFSVRLAS